MNLQDYAESSESQETIMEEDMSLDDLFSDVQDEAGTETDGTYSTLLDDIANASTENSLDSANSTVWNFILCGTKDNIRTKKLIKDLNNAFSQKGWAVQAINWRSAAGGTVALTFYLRTIFNIGIILILLTGFIVVNNTLVISALGRVGETGTLRAIGAERTFVASQFFLETFFLTASAGLLATVLGTLGATIVQGANIELNNEYLSQLFGDTTLTAVVTGKNIARLWLITVALSAIGWIYPARVALSTNPIEAMRSMN